MNRSPSTVDALLSTRLAAYGLEKQGLALRSFLEDDSETVESLRNLNSGLKTSLLGSGSLEVLTNCHFLGALTNASEQEESQMHVISDEVDISQSDIDSPGRLPRSLDVESKTSQKVDKNRRQGTFATLDPDSPAGVSSIKHQNSNRQPNSFDGHLANTFGPHAAHQKKHRKQVFLRGLDSNGQYQNSPPARIDATQASDSMAQRAVTAGMDSAWNSVISSSPRHSMVMPQSESSHPMKAGKTSVHNAKSGVNTRNSDSTAFTGKPENLETRSLGVAGDQLEQSLESLLNHSCEVPDTTSDPKPNRRNDTPVADKQRTQTHSKSRAGRKNTGPEKQSGFASEPALPGESGFRNRTTPGGLRGLLEQAKGSLNDVESTDGASEIPRQVKNIVPQFDSNDSPNSASGSRVDEFAKLLADEARRAGINLEQFQP